MAWVTADCVKCILSAAALMLPSQHDFVKGLQMAQIRQRHGAHRGMQSLRLL